MTPLQKIGHLKISYNLRTPFALIIFKHLLLAEEGAVSDVNAIMERNKNEVASTKRLCVALIK